MLSFNQISKRIIQNDFLESQFFSKSLAPFKSLLPCFQNHSFNVYYIINGQLFVSFITRIAFVERSSVLLHSS